MVWRPRSMPSPARVSAKRVDEPVGREHGVEVRGAKEARQIGTPKLPERGHSACAGAGDRRSPRRRSSVASRKRAVWPRQRLEVDPAKLGVGGGIARPAQRAAELVGAFERRAVKRVEPLRQHGVARLLERRPTVRLRLVGLLDRDARYGTGPSPGSISSEASSPASSTDSARVSRPEQSVERELEQVTKPALLVVAAGGGRPARSTAPRPRLRTGPRTRS